VLDARVGKTLADSIAQAEETLNQEIDSIDDRATALEAEIAAAHRDLGTDEETGEPIEDSLAQRFSAIESSVVLNNNSIDEIAAQISHAADPENDDAGGLTERLSAVETVVGNAAVASTVEAALNNLDGRLDKIDGGEALTDAGTLASRVTSAESNITNIAGRVSTLETTPKSATIIVNADCITYDAETGMPTLYTNDTKTTTITPTADADYLLQKDDGKYYYWKYIDNAWNLISGGGGAESGNSSAIITDTLPQIENADLNTDYYVGTPSTGYIHYRFTVVHDMDLDKDVIQAVVIGQQLDTNYIKRYNIDKVYNSDNAKYYLKLYEYNYGTENEVDDDLDVPSWVAETSYAVDDRVLYNGYIYQCITANNDAEWTAGKWTRISEVKTVAMIELPEGGGGGIISNQKIYRITERNLT